MKFGNYGRKSWIVKRYGKWKKTKLNSEKIWKLWKKSKLNSEKIVEMENMEEK